MCSERSSLVNLGCKRQLSQEARRSVQLSQLCAKVQCAAENLGFTLQDVAVAGSVAVAGFPRALFPHELVQARRASVVELAPPTSLLQHGVAPREWGKPPILVPSEDSIVGSDAVVSIAMGA